MGSDQKPGDSSMPGEATPGPAEAELPSVAAAREGRALPSVEELAKAVETPLLDGEYATWDDLCDPTGREKDYVLPSGKKIRYRCFVPLEQYARIRMAATVGGRFDNARFSVLLLKQVLIRPRIEDDSQMQLALKADGTALLDILADVQNIVERYRQMTEQNVGEL